jgi:DNA-binding GntR family transcriptional regulator
MRCSSLNSACAWSGLKNESARCPDLAQAALLDIPVATPLLSVERLAYTYNDTPMELRRGLYHTDTHHYRNALN